MTNLQEQIFRQRAKKLVEQNLELLKEEYNFNKLRGDYAPVSEAMFVGMDFSVRGIVASTHRYTIYAQDERALRKFMGGTKLEDFLLDKEDDYVKYLKNEKSNIANYRKTLGHKKNRW